MASPTSTKASQVGWMFVPQYYTFVNKDPAKLHCFYTKKSTLIHGVEGEDSQPCYGQQDIHEKIMSLGFEDCKVFVSTVDSQSSAEGGIIIQVVGELSNRGGPWRKFAQTFFLAEQPNGYFVLNDIFRYIKEESDEDEAVNEDSASTTAASAAPTGNESATTAAQQDVNYDQLNNTATVGGEQQQQSSAPTQDFELAQQHGTPADAAGVTVAPPTEAHQEDARANLEDLASGQTEQQQVVELHDDLNQDQPEQASSSSAADASAQVNGDHSQEEAAAPAQEEAAAAPAATSSSSSSAAPAAAEASSSAAPAPAAAAASSDSSAPAAAQVPSKPSAPKTWASLAAANQKQWQSQVKSTVAGVSSAVPTSSSTGASRSSTPAGPSAGKNNAEQSSSSANQQQQGQGQGPPKRYENIETEYRVLVSNVVGDINAGHIRRRLEDALARRTDGQKQRAELSYIDMNKRDSTAFVHFKEAWALENAKKKGSVDITGTLVTLEVLEKDAIPEGFTHARGNHSGGRGARGGARGGNASGSRGGRGARGANKPQ